MQVVVRSTSPGMVTVHHTSFYGRFIEIKSNSGERSVEEQMKAPIFLKEFLAIGAV